MLYFCGALIVISILMILVSGIKWIVSDYAEDEYAARKGILSWTIVLIGIIAFTAYWKNRPVENKNIYLKDQRIIVTEKTDNKIVSSVMGTYEVYYNNNTVTFVNADGSSISFDFYNEN